MDTVWVVEEGWYSDYHVVGVFTKKEAAEFVAGYCGGRVDEWPLDPIVGNLRKGLFIHAVSMHRDGSVISVEKRTDSWSLGNESEPYVVSGYGKERVSIVCANVWAKDEKHAIKIVNEKRVQFIANNEL